MSIFHYRRIKLAVLIESSHSVEAWSLTLSFVALWLFASTCVMRVTHLVERVDSVVAVGFAVVLVALVSLEGGLKWSTC